MTKIKFKIYSYLCDVGLSIVLISHFYIIYEKFYIAVFFILQLQ